MLYKIILAGGGGTRLIPLSTEENPKQFISLIGEDSLLQTTFKRMKGHSENTDNIFISSSSKYKEKILQQLPINKNQLILESERKNTAPAIALIVKALEENWAKEDDLILISPADHIITPQETFEQYIHQGEEYTKQGNIVLFGIQPTYPEIGYGYIKVKENDTISDIDSFKEKPDQTTAEKYINEGNYLWNSWMFLFSVKTIQEAFKKHCPDIYKYMTWNLEHFIQNFQNLKPISIDYAIMEKADNIKICSMKNLERIDIGDWERLKGFYKKYPNTISSTAKLYLEQE